MLRLGRVLPPHHRQQHAVRLRRILHFIHQLTHANQSKSAGRYGTSFHLALEANLPNFGGKLVQAKYEALRNAENGTLGNARAVVGQVER